MSRINFKVDAILSYKKFSHKCCVRNISLTGLFLVTDKDVQEGENVTVTVIVESESTAGQIVLQCKVTRRDKDGVGLEFTEMPLDSYMFLRNIVAYNYGDFNTIDQEYCRHLASRKIKTPGE